MDFQITSGIIPHAKKTVIYGTEGVGKTLLAAKFPQVAFIDIENGTQDYPLNRLPKPTSWEMLKQELEWVKNTKPCKTLAIDTVDWAERMCLEYICKQHNKKGIEDFGYGNGWTYEKEEFGRFLNMLTEIIDEGIHVILIAHADVRKFEQPDEMGSYDRWELKLGKKTTNHIAPLIKEWADIVLFCAFKTVSVAVDKDGKKHKGQGGNKRVMYTTHHACWDAKNRYGLPEEIPMDYEQIRHIFEDNAPLPVPEAEPAPAATAAPVAPAGIPKALADLMAANHISEEQIRKAVVAKGFFPEDMPVCDYPADFVEGVLIGAWEQVYSFIIENDYPF